MTNFKAPLQLKLQEEDFLTGSVFPASEEDNCKEKQRNTLVRSTPKKLKIHISLLNEISLILIGYMSQTCFDITDG